MYLSISSSGELSLEDIDNMKSFSITETADAPESVRASVVLASMSEAAEDNHYWLDANAVINLSAKAGDPQWVEAFWQMLKAVEAYGYSDILNKRVKAHVEIQDQT